MDRNRTERNEKRNRKKLGIFGGTYEGRMLAEFCRKEGIPVVVSVATAYGEQLLISEAAEYKEQRSAGEVSTGRMDAGEMTAWIQQNHIAAVVDATHPFAQAVSEQIRLACAAARTEYRRLKREELDKNPAVIWCSSIEEAADFLNGELLHYPEKRALLTTGSKELSCFVREKTLLSRLFVRVLPSVEAINACLEAGFCGKQIIAMQGPFSREMNQAVLHTVQASYLVTKESGQTGGFSEKVEAALAYGCQVIAVKRPEEKEEGDTLDEIKHWLRKSWKNGRKIECSSKENKTGEIQPENSAKEKERTNREITLVGIGTGGADQITWEGIQALGKADAFLGALRMVESGKEICRAVMNSGVMQENWILPVDKQECITYKKEEIFSWLEEHTEVNYPVVLFSGDTGFYSGAKGLRELLADKRVRLLPGISSLSCFAAKIGRSWENTETISFHGREEEIDWTLADKKERFFLLDGTKRLHQICRCLIQNGQAKAELWVGENLSYPTEKLVFGSPEEILRMEFGKLLVAWVAPG